MNGRQNQTKLTWDSLIRNLPKTPNNAIRGIWCNGEEILCKTGEQAEAIADFIDALGIGDAITGQYDDPVPIDQNSGYYYVAVD